MPMKMNEERGRCLVNERGSATSTLLLLLLLVAAGGAYLYYFTDLIRPQTEEPAPQEVQSPQVKMPMPVRHDQLSSAQAPLPQGGKGASVKGEPPVNQPSAKQQGKQSPATPTKPTTSAPSKTTPGKMAQAPVAAPTVPSPKSKPAPVEKPVIDEPQVKEQNGSYIVVVGSYAADELLEADKRKVKKAGLTPVVKAEGTKKVTMTRLFLGSYKDKGTADRELARLKQFSDGAFIMQEGSGYAVYGGSYSVATMAKQERDRLADLGMTLVLKHAKIPMSVKKLTAGHFSSKQAANNAVGRLKKHGIRATVHKVSGK
jgi:cell division septation protein DedD